MKLTGDTDLNTVSIDALKDVLIDNTTLSDSSFLVYDAFNKRWVNKEFDELFTPFVGAEADIAGIAGFVPAPEAGQTNLFLRSDGIWAPIPTGGGATGNDQNIFVLTNTEKLEHITLINNATMGLTLYKGDIAIIKELIFDDNYQRTAYVYNGIAWEAMNGNYDAKNVYFSTDFVFTENIGTVEIPEKGNIKVEAVGKNVEDFVKFLSNKEKNPETIQPTLEIVFEEVTGNHEVGSVVTPKYSIQFEDGHYTYGTAMTPPEETGVVITSCNITSNAGESFTTTEGTFANVTVGDDTNWSVVASVVYSDGLIPLTNLEHEYPEGQIKGNIIEKEQQIFGGYRAFFYGMVDNTNEINSDLIRSLINGGAYDEPKILRLAALEGDKRSIIALPADSTREGITSILLASTMNIPITNEYKKLENTINVEGLNGYAAKPYNVYVYEPDAGIGSDEVHIIELG